MWSNMTSTAKSIFYYSFYMMGMGDIAGLGAIPLFIGLAYVLIWHLEKKKAGAAG